MRELIFLILTIIAGFALLLLTSWMLDLEWIRQEVARMVVVYMLMAVEAGIAYLIIKELLNSK